jgi:hypothetical protein
MMNFHNTNSPVCLISNHSLGIGAQRAQHQKKGADVSTRVSKGEKKQVLDRLLTLLICAIVTEQRNTVGNEIP